jgi:mRNA interferase RelE/StbE
LTYGVEFTSRARKDLERIEKSDGTRIVEAITQHATTGRGDVKKLAAIRPSRYRLRVGGWRVLFEREEASKLIRVLRVLPREDAYRRP